MTTVSFEDSPRLKLDYEPEPTIYPLKDQNGQGHIYFYQLNGKWICEIAIYQEEEGELKPDRCVYVEGDNQEEVLAQLVPSKRKEGLS